MNAARPTAATVYSADLVIPITAPPVLQGAVAVADGRILHVGTRDWVLELLRDDGVAVHEEQHTDGVILPGLVNAHSHLQYSGMSALGQGRYRGFEDWARAHSALYDSTPTATPWDWAADAAAGAADMIAHGITAVADIVTDIEALGVLRDAGLHGITYWEVMDWENAAWQERGHAQVIEEFARVPLVPGAGLSPHAPYSLDVLPLLEIPDIARRSGGRLHLHLGESHFEGERDTTAAGEGNEHWHFAGLPSFRALREQGFGASATEFVDELGVLGPDCHIAHGVYMTANDRALLRARGTSVALCPRSNEVIGLDPPPVAAYLDEGSPIAVGTDSLSSSPSLDLMSDVAALATIARAQGYTGRDLHARLLAAATLGGARAMGLDIGPDRLGHLAVGALADLAWFDLPVGRIDDTLADLVESGAGRAVSTAIAGDVRWRQR